MVEEKAIPRPDPDVLSDSIALSKETLKGQLAMADGRLRRMESLLRLGVVGLAGILAVVGLLINAGARPGLVESIGFASGVVFNITALLFFLSGTSGFPRPYAILLGPRFGIKRLEDPSWDHITFQVSVLDFFDQVIRHNDKSGERLDGQASIGTAWLIGSVISYTATLAYILGGLILA